MIRLQEATLEYIALMQEMVKEEVDKGVILPRDDDEIASNIRSYILAFIDDELVGYGALHIHSRRLAEIRSLVVKTTHHGKGIGRAIVLEALKEAKRVGIAQEVLVLTYVDDFFAKLGFEPIAKEEIPEHKIWADCIHCKHFPVCNEIALVYKLEQN